jgi:hypothetical protein
MKGRQGKMSPGGQRGTDGIKRAEGMRRKQVGTMRKGARERSQGWVERWGMKAQRQEEGREPGWGFKGGRKQRERVKLEKIGGI